MINEEKYNKVFKFVQSFQGMLHFGTLLWYVRKGIDHVFDTDIDIGIIPENYHKSLEQVFRKEKYLEDATNVHDYYTNAHFKIAGVTIDIYWWHKLKGDEDNYWHLYIDPNNQKGITGKAMPKHIFQIPDCYKTLAERSQAYTSKEFAPGGWMVKHPEYFRTSQLKFYLPARYGEFLDICYPGWLAKREKFGASWAYQKDCKKSWLIVT